VHVVDKAVHLFVALGQVVGAVQPAEVRTEPVVQVGRVGEAVGVDGDVEQLSKVAATRGPELVADQRGLATAGLAGDHDRLVQVHHDVEHAVQEHGAGRVHEDVEGYALVDGTAERGDYVGPEGELVLVDVVEVVVDGGLFGVGPEDRVKPGVEEFAAPFVHAGRDAAGSAVFDHG